MKTSHLVIAFLAGAIGLASPLSAQSNQVPLPRISPVPEQIESVPDIRVDLNGTWKYDAKPGKEFWTNMEVSGDGWSDYEVPGILAMQELPSPGADPAACYRRFEVPDSWQGMRVKLRCDGIFAGPTIWINGQAAGRHASGFTSFELDVTDAIKFGEENSIVIALPRKHISDQLASASAYAKIDLTGITRKLYLYPTPDLTFSSLHVETDFDKNYQDATLMVRTKVSLDGAAAKVSNAKVEFALKDASGKEVALADAVRPLTVPGANEQLEQDFEFKVAAPAKWDTEHPNLYTLSATISGDGLKTATYERRIGFREIEMRGNEVFVNNQPIKLRGTNLHESDPLTARSITPERARQDAELFKEANINHVRTSHYPPSEEFIAACDELGIFVAEEGPFCFMNVGKALKESNKSKNDMNLPDLDFIDSEAAMGEDNDAFYPEGEHAKIVYPILEMVERDRSSPSVIMWSIANESAINPAFEEASRRVLEMDPTRITTFSWQEGGHNPAFSLYEVHYPHVSILQEAKKSPVPIYAGELRLTPGAYIRNPQEVITDPGVCDFWGMEIKKAWEVIATSPGALGGAIWCGIDEQVHMPDETLAGIAAWGLVDEWRRPKAEYWNVKKVYTPVVIREESVEFVDGALSVPVENRFLFSNLSETKITWKLGEETGTVEVDVPPGEKGKLSIQPSNQPESEILKLKIESADGRQIDSYELAVGEQPVAPAPYQPIAGPVSASEQGGKIVVSSGPVEWQIDKTSGMVSSAVGGQKMVVNGPHIWGLTVETTKMKNKRNKKKYMAETRFIPQDGLYKNWKCESVELNSANGVEVTVTGSYDEAEGSYVLNFKDDGRVAVTYDFASKIEITPRQLGVVFDLDPAFDTINWQRDGEWSNYPEDHIGREIGTATAFRDKQKYPAVDFWTEPSWPWMLDENEQGTRDFRSTKRNIIQASMQSPTAALVIDSEGSLAVRPWVDGDVIRVLSAMHNRGATRGADLIPDLKLKSGDSFEDTVDFQVTVN